MAGKTVIDTLVTVLTVDAQGVEKGVDKSNKALTDATKNAKETSQEVNKLTTNYKSLGTAVTFLAATLGASHIVKNSVDIANASARTGQSAGNILALQRAYEKAGFSAGEAMGTIEEFAAAQRSAAFGGDASKWMDLTLGTSYVRDAKGNMTDIAEAMFKAGDQAKRMTRNEQEAMMLLQQRGYSAAAAYQAVNAEARATYREIQKQFPFDQARAEQMRRINALLQAQKHALYDVGTELIVGLNPALIATTKFFAETQGAAGGALAAFIAFKTLGVNPITIALAAMIAALVRANAELEKGEKERANKKTASQGAYRQALAQGATGGGEDDENVLFRSGVKGLRGNGSGVLNDRESALASVLRKAEGGKAGYNAFNRGSVNSASSGDLTNMTVGEIMAAQSRKEMFAAGAYQVVPKTLEQAVLEMGLDKGTKFDARTQDMIFKHLANKRAGNYLSGASDDVNAAQRELSKEWAAIADPTTGQSYYHGIGGNKSSISSLDYAMRNAGGGAVIGSQTTVGEVKIYAGNADAAGVKTEFDGYVQKTGNNRMFNTGAAS